MNYEWLSDGRKIPDDVMHYIRVMAVHAVRGLGQSPEIVAKTYNFNRPCIYRWLRQCDEGGYEALKSDMPAGAKPLIDAEMDDRLKSAVLDKTPVDHGHDTNLWTCAILAEILKEVFDVTVGESAVRLHLKRLGPSFQKPKYRDAERDEKGIERFLDDKFPRMQRLADKLGADIGFQDESGVGVMTRHGRTWGLRGKTPEVDICMKRGGYNVLSIITDDGQMRYSIKDGHVDGQAFVEFLQLLVVQRERPSILLVDHASFHGSAPVRDFV